MVVPAAPHVVLMLVDDVSPVRKIDWAGDAALNVDPKYKGKDLDVSTAETVLSTVVVLI